MAANDNWKNQPRVPKGDEDGGQWAAAGKAAYAAASVPMRSGPGPLPGQGRGSFAEGDTVKIVGNVSGAGMVGRVVQISPSGGYFGVQDILGQWLGYFHESDLEPDRGDGEDWDEED